ncbi:hypothetical protein UPYG_G00008810 [Umbra pygmaea]|uniref:Uncharacterized protein n=1 Tax=Umbra pygmaea TaxID=75934 RepID=A0ABD0XI30_UMBPY
MSLENWFEHCPRGKVRRSGPLNAQLASEDPAHEVRQSQVSTQNDKVGDSRSCAKINNIQEMTSETSEAVDQLQKGAETCVRGKQESSVAHRKRERATVKEDGEPGGPGVCLEVLCDGGSMMNSPPEGVMLLPYLEIEMDRQTKEPRGPGPFFFLGGGNGASLVSSYFESRGWQRIYDKTRVDFNLKWCEIKSTATYSYFKEGEQLVYQIPNNKVLTNKIGLLSSLRDYERICRKLNHGRGLRWKMEEFFPTTFRMDVGDEREAFFALQEGMCDEEMSAWICKPTGLNQGRGIFLLRTQEDISAFKLRLQTITKCQSNKKLHFRLPQARIMQRYIQNPLLLNGRKFDVRSYFLIACTSPYMVFFHHGYLRLTCDLYDHKSQNLSSHLTNQYIQKKNPLYSVLKEETVWSMDRLNTYINDKLSVDKGLPKDWVLTTFTKRMQQIIIQCFLAVKAKLDRKLGYFDLIGCDFMIDEDFKVWLLEMNCNPALHTNCEVLKEVIPSTVVETLDLTLEIFNKCCRGQKLLPLASLRDFVLLYDGATAPVPALSQTTNTAATRVQCPKSVSTQKRLTSKTQKAVASVSEEKVMSETTPVVIMDVSESLPCGTPPAAANDSRHNNLPLQVTTNTHTTPGLPPRAHPMPKHSCRPHEPTRVHRELKLSKCTWQRRLDNSKRCKPTDLRVKRTLISLSTPALIEGSCHSGNRIPVTKLGNTDQALPFSYALRPTQFHLVQPRNSCPPADRQSEEGKQIEGRLGPGGR